MYQREQFSYPHCESNSGCVLLLLLFFVASLKADDGDEPSCKQKKVWFSKEETVIGITKNGTGPSCDIGKDIDIYGQLVDYNIRRGFEERESEEVTLIIRLHISFPLVAKVQGGAI